MVQYRTFHNRDPKRFLKLWHNSGLGPSAAEGFPCDILEYFVFSLPFFDPKGFFLATEGEEVLGICHASFPPVEDESRLDNTQGCISALMVHPDFRRQGIGRELVQRAEAYLAAAGATSIQLGAGLDRNGFYNGIYGGLQSSGFNVSSGPWHEFAESLGYAPATRTQILHRDLSSGRDPVSSRLIRHRRRLNLVITDRASEMSWWWHARFGQLDSLQFELRQRHDEDLVASSQIVGLDVFVPKWGIRAVGIQQVIVPEESRRHGYGLSLVLEICRRLREQSIQLIEAQVDEANPAALELFQTAGFECVELLSTWQRSL